MIHLNRIRDETLQPPQDTEQANSGLKGILASQLFKSANRMGFLLVVLSASLYFLTHDNGFAANDLEGGDTPTLQYGQINGRPANGPGYPVYTMIGFLWFHSVRFIQGAFFDPLPNPIPIFSTFNTIWALLALWIFYRLLLRLTSAMGLSGPRWLFPWQICLFYACTYQFWWHANSSEQYCSVVAQTLALVLLFLKWEESLDSDFRESGKNEEGPSSRLLLFTMAFLCGLFLAHQVTATMIVPPLVVAVLQRRPSLLRLPKVVMGTVLAAVAPIISYLFIYIRGAQGHEWRGNGTLESDLEWFIEFVSVPQGQGEIKLGLQSTQPFFTGVFPQHIWHEVSFPVLILGLLGITLFRPRLRFLLFGTLTCYFIFAWVNRFGNWHFIFMPAYPLILLGLLPIAARVQQTLLKWLTARFVNSHFQASTYSAFASAIPLLFLLSATYWTLTSSWDKADQRDRPRDIALDIPAMLLAQQIPSQTVLYANFPIRVGLGYLISAWGFRPELSSVSEDKVRQQLANGGRAAVTTGTARFLLKHLRMDGLDLQRVAPDWILLSHGTSEAHLFSPEHKQTYSLGDGIVLKGLTAVPSPGPLIPTKDSCKPCLEAEGSLDVTLFWGSESESKPNDWSISLRAYAGGEPVTTVGGAPVRQDSPGPVYGLRPFSLIGSNQTVLDSYRLPAAANADSLFIIIYRQVEGGFDNLAELMVPLK